jgi:hypothetical protein
MPLITPPLPPLETSRSQDRASRFKEDNAGLVDELADEAIDRPPGDLAMACQATAMSAMGES